MSSITTNKRVLCSPPQNTASSSLSSSYLSSSPPSYSDEEYKTPKIPDTIPPPDYETDEEFKHMYIPQDGDEEIRNARLQRLKLLKEQKEQQEEELPPPLPTTLPPSIINKLKNKKQNDRKKRQKNKKVAKENEILEKIDKIVDILMDSNVKSEHTKTSNIFRTNDIEAINKINKLNDVVLMCGNVGDRQYNKFVFDGKVTRLGYTDSVRDDLLSRAEDQFDDSSTKKMEKWFRTMHGMRVLYINNPAGEKITADFCTLFCKLYLFFLHRELISTNNKHISTKIQLI